MTSAQPETRTFWQVFYHQADISMCSHCLLRHQLMIITSLLQVLNRLAERLKTCRTACRLDASCFTNLQQVCKYQVAASLIFRELVQLYKVNKLDITCWLVKSITCTKSVAFLAVQWLTHHSS